MIYKKIKELREQNNMTQSQLAKKLGISRSAVNAWELAVTIPSANYLIELSKVFNTSIDYILDIRGEETVNISSLSDSQKKIIYSLVNEFKKNRQAENMLKVYGVNVDDLDNDENE